MKEVLASRRVAGRKAEAACLTGCPRSAGDGCPPCLLTYSSRAWSGRCECVQRVPLAPLGHLLLTVLILQVGKGRAHQVQQLPRLSEAPRVVARAPGASSQPHRGAGAPSGRSSFPFQNPFPRGRLAARAPLGPWTGSPPMVRSASWHLAALSLETCIPRAWGLSSGLHGSWGAGPPRSVPTGGRSHQKNE